VVEADKALIRSLAVSCTDIFLPAGCCGEHEPPDQYDDPLSLVTGGSFGHCTARRISVKAWRPSWRSARRTSVRQATATAHGSRVHPTCELQDMSRSSLEDLEAQSCTGANCCMRDDAVVESSVWNDCVQIIKVFQCEAWHGAVGLLQRMTPLVQRHDTAADTASAMWLMHVVACQMLATPVLTIADQTGQH